jgi:hypothetical protein
MRRNLSIALAAAMGTSLACSESPTPIEVSAIDAPTLDAPAKDTPVKSELLGAGSVQSDGLGAYLNGTGGVVSIMGAGGDWVLELNGRRSTRHARVDLSDTLPGNPSAPPFSSVLVQPRFITKASEVTSGGLLSMVGLGSTRLTPLSLAFTYNGTSYGVRMNPNNHGETDWALATCAGVVDPGNPATSACNKWSVTPNGNYGGVAKNVAYLERVGSPSVFIGLVYMSFDVLVTK